MKVAISADHAGFDLKTVLVDHLHSRGIEVEDFGALELVPTDDFVEYAHAVAETVASGTHDSGILVCGSGIGMSVAANKVRGIRAALCTSAHIAYLARAHNDANVLALAAAETGPELARSIVDTWLDTEFEDKPRYVRRIGKLELPET
ncbi:unnamed protein product [marine sediment metagenome]|uniref:Ribose 5-phosphate isomerase B n=1 Tax=marine sediment metagenome TaxID=412755 RepID=X0V8C6_9ZZZZ